MRWNARRQTCGRHTQTLGGGHCRLLRCRRRERALDCMPDELVNRARIAKTDFDFLRVHVDIDATRIELEP